MVGVKKLVLVVESSPGRAWRYWRQYDLLRVPEIRWMSEQQPATPALPGVGMAVVLVVMLGVVELL